MIKTNPSMKDVRRRILQVYNNSGLYAYRNERAGADNGMQSALYDPLRIVTNQYGNLRTADRFYNRNINCKILRRVAEKAWLINVCIGHVIKKIRPYLKPVSDKNLRGFIIRRKNEDVKTNDAEAERINSILLKTGIEDDFDRDDTFVKYSSKIIRDLLTIDQVATELQYRMDGGLYAFYAIDGETIEKVIPGQENPYKIKYVQVINHIPYAFYRVNELLMDYQNPRSDIEHSFYGYSYVEQAIDLVSASINSFAYNTGAFTDDNLPRGILLLDGKLNEDGMNEMEDYLCEIMSGGAAAKRKIPILQSGEKENTVKWVPLNTNKEMEFQNWIDFLSSAIVAMFGLSMEDIGLHSQKSAPVFERNATPKIEASKSLVLGDMLMFLQDYFNRIVEKINPEYELEFVGYERDDPKQVLEIDKEEVASYKTLNEKREEKGLKKLDADWADIPLNPQAVQMFQAAQGSGVGGGMEDMEGDNGFAGGGAPEEGGSGEADDKAWEGLEGEGVEKSLIKNNAMRICI